MEKLIELLNKFIKEKKYYHWTFEDEKDVSKYECLIISKQFEFIEWLVERNLIYKPTVIYSTDIEIYHKQYWKPIKSIEIYERAIMLLSISENPTALLISFLI